MTSLPQAKRFDWTTWACGWPRRRCCRRPVRGRDLDPGGWPFLLLIAVAVGAAGHRVGRDERARRADAGRGGGHRVGAWPACSGLLRLATRASPGWPDGDRRACRRGPGRPRRRRAAGRRGLRRVLYRAAPCLALSGCARTNQKASRWTLHAVRRHLGGRHRRLRGRQRVEGPQALAAILAQQDLVRLRRRPDRGHAWLAVAVDGAGQPEPS